MPLRIRRGISGNSDFTRFGDRSVLCRKLLHCGPRRLVRTAELELDPVDGVGEVPCAGRILLAFDRGHDESGLQSFYLFYFLSDAAENRHEPRRGR